MEFQRNKKAVLSGVVLLVLLSFSFFIPVTCGYGLTANTAELIIPGIYDETLDAAHLEAWYKVTGRDGATLTVVITYDNSSYELWAWLYCPNDTLADDHTTRTAKITLTTICDSDLNYTLGIARVATSGYIDFTLTITLPDEEIPSFDLLAALFGITALLGLVISYKRFHSH